MNSIIKKLMIYSMAGMMQIGFSATVIEASPLPIEGPQRIVQLEDGQQIQENNRHERELRQRPNEDEQEWHNHQSIE